MKNLVFVISLKSDEARREKLKERFKNYGEFKLVEATDGRAMSAKEYYGYALASLEAYGRLSFLFFAGFKARSLPKEIFFHLIEILRIFLSSRQGLPDEHILRRS